MRLGTYLSELTKPELNNLYEICGLTEEETQICELIRNGKTYIQIENKLGYSTKTIYRRVLIIKNKIDKNRKEDVEKMKLDVEIKDKINLTVKEAAAYSNIGENKIRELLKEPNCDFLLNVGTHILIKREKFENYLNKINVI